MRVAIRRPSVIAIALLAVASCGGSSSSSSLLTPTPERSGGGVTLSGRIFEVLPDGTRRPTRARQVSVEVEVPTPLGPDRGGWVPVDVEGRYRLPGVPDGRFVKISAVDTFGSSSIRRRLCATNTVTRGDTELDVNLYLPGAVVPGPTLSGQVFAMIGGQRMAVVGKNLYFQSRGFGPDVVELTDADGRYDFCGLPPIPGTQYLVCGNDITAYSEAVEVRTDTVIDIDATEFHQCL